MFMVTGQCHCGKTSFQLDGTWDGQTRIIAVNARLLDGFVADDAQLTVVDGKNLWRRSDALPRC
jgi:hypothetical protein